MTRHDGVVYVTGAASGIGRRAAERMAETGAAVAAVDVDEVGLAALARANTAIRPFVVDVADTAAVAESVLHRRARARADRSCLCGGRVPPE